MDAERAIDAGSDVDDLYRTLVHLSPDAVVIHVDGRIVFINEAGLRLLHADRPEQVIGRPVLDFVQPQFRATVQERIRHMRESGVPVPPIDEGFIALDGSEFHGETTAAPLIYRGAPAMLVLVRDVSERLRASQALDFLATASRVLASSLDYETTLANVARLAVPRIADWCVVDVLTENGTLARLAAAHADPDRERWAVEMGRRYPPDAAEGAGRVMQRQTSEVATDITDETLVRIARDDEHLQILRHLEMRSGMSVPLVARGRSLGVITFIGAESGRRFTAQDLPLAEDLARRAATAVDNARLYRDAERARDDAEAQRSHLHALFMQAPAIIAVFRGPDHVFELANPDYAALVGRRDFVGRPGREAVPDPSQRPIFDLLDQVYRTGRPYSASEMALEFSQTDAGTAETRFFNLVLQPVCAGDTVEGVMLHAVEVTEEVRARQQIERLAAERQAILRQMAEGISIADPSGRVIFSNEAARRIAGVARTGLQVEAYAERRHVTTLDGQPLPAEQMALARALRGETVIDDMCRIRRSDGTEVVVQSSAGPVRTEDGELLGAVTVFRDVTAHYMFERQKDDFLSAAAHDLKTPLATIKGTAQILARRAVAAGDGESRLMRGLGQIDSTATKMAALVNELLDATRIHMSRPIDLNLGPVDLVSVLREVVNEQRPSARHQRIRLETDVPGLVGLWDGLRLARVFANLLSNAIRYSPNGGEILVSIWREYGQSPEKVEQLEPGTLQQGDRNSERREDTAVIQVRDEGIGVPEDDLPHIFERFYRGRNVSGQIAGTGIGLAGVRQIVEQHGGTVTADSFEGEGSTFTVRLPIREPEESA